MGYLLVLSVLLSVACAQPFFYTLTNYGNGDCSGSVTGTGVFTFGANYTVNNLPPAGTKSSCQLNGGPGSPDSFQVQFNSATSLTLLLYSANQFCNSTNAQQAPFTCSNQQVSGALVCVTPCQSFTRNNTQLSYKISSPADASFLLPAFAMIVALLFLLF